MAAQSNTLRQHGHAAPRPGGNGQPRPARPQKTAPCDLLGITNYSKHLCCSAGVLTGDFQRRGPHCAEKCRYFSLKGPTSADIGNARHENLKWSDFKFKNPAVRTPPLQERRLIPEIGTLVRSIENMRFQIQISGDADIAATAERWTRGRVW